MRNISRIPLLFSLLCLPGKAWGQGVPVAPDCQLFMSFSTAASTATFDNRTAACVTWTVQYTATGFTGLTLTFQSAQGAVTPGTFGAYGGTLVTGANPMTITTGEVSSFKNGTVNIPWVRMTLSGLSGTGNVVGVLYGYKAGSGGGGGGGGGGTCPEVTPCVVIGPDAPGSASSQNPVQVAGNDGTDVRAVKTDSSGDTLVAGSAPAGSAAGNPVTFGYKDDSSNALSAFAFPDQGAFTLSSGTDVVVVAGTSAKKTYLGHLSFTADSAQTVTIRQGTGSTCGTGTLTVAGPYPNAAAFALDFSAAGGLHTTVNANDLCLHFGGSVTAGGGVVYGVH